MLAAVTRGDSIEPSDYLPPGYLERVTASCAGKAGVETLHKTLREQLHIVQEQDSLQKVSWNPVKWRLLTDIIIIIITTLTKALSSVKLCYFGLFSVLLISENIKLGLDCVIQAVAIVWRF